MDTTTTNTPETTRHEYEPGEGRHAMHTDPVCQVCGEPRRAAVHK